MVQRISFQDKFYIEYDDFLLQPWLDQSSGHTHHHLEISFIKKGEGIYYIDGQEFPAKEGDIYIFNNLEQHGIKVTSHSPMINAVIHFEPWLIWNTPNDFFNEKYLKIFFQRPSHFTNRLEGNCEVSSRIKELFDEIQNEFENQQQDYDLMIKVKLLNILVILSRHYQCKDDPQSSGHKKDLQSINKVMHYMDIHYKDQIKLKDLAELVYMNPSYFSRFFKKFNGLSPMDYLAHVRIKKAIDLLSNTDHAIIDIAGMCGFNSTANFNKTFKRIEGKPPSSFRK
ncbi:AraC family transcriptional regulator [Vallitalea okinawensis]|uniref:AraC family transcriptional regulator n=1 Tax=Vallitalea okinawensis TaxID=2078660 RepID=UPI000CFACDB8|nr:helix-turn-helix domain-containing protein [Vallitalea okinawensis]